MSRSTLERLAPLTGIAFVALLVISFIVGGDTPDADESTEEVVAFWTEEDSSQIASAIIGAWAAVFLVWFGGTLAAALRRAEVEASRLASIAFGGFLLIAVGGLSFSAFQFAAADTAGDVPAEVTQTLSVLFEDFFFPLAAGTVLALLSVGVAALRHGVLPRWLGYAAIVIAIAALTPAGFFAFLAAGVWVLAVSVVLYSSGTAPPTQPPASRFSEQP
jgi:hypothetical protein